MFHLGILIDPEVCGNMQYKASGKAIFSPLQNPHVILVLHICDICNNKIL